MTRDAVALRSVGIEMRRTGRIAEHILVHIVTAGRADSHSSLESVSGEETGIGCGIVEIVVAERGVKWEVNGKVAHQTVAVLILGCRVGHGGVSWLIGGDVAHDISFRDVEDMCVFVE